ncbi:PhzF family phenazine biosynthesis protein [Lichenihabitans psoromatis]|uniref:PhzF family phenazine biosynthesis protein n=1 Tax=Lichenihabitans psoromatis TaxID=2528642 RepID=UPI001035C2C1|nr:PhzF family phenazine biosynthesis protein [Lichenihabitans psoromatis]
MSRPFATLDVFTDVALAGNPLAIVLDADALDPARMQAIAREFNLSETVFVQTPRDPAHEARLRIFTPAAELPFAGHPTVGTAVFLALRYHRDRLATGDVTVVLDETIGPVTCRVRMRAGVAHARFDLPRLPASSGTTASNTLVAAALDLTVDDIGFGRHVSSVFSAGVAFTFIPLRDREALARARPDLTRWRDAFGEFGAVYLYTDNTASPDHQIRARMFAPNMGIAEDPATGGAVAAFAGVLLHYGDLADGDHAFIIEQGFELGRPSLIELGLTLRDGRLVSASIGGTAIVVSHGTLELE